MFSIIGKTILHRLSEVGNITILLGDVLKRIRGTLHLKNRIIEQMYLLGIKSIPMASLTAMFVSMAFTLQISNEFIKFGAGETIGGIVAIATWRELSPLLTAVVFSGRVGASIAAEIASMKVTEQIDALEVMSQNTIKFLVIPRVIAGFICLPLLVGLANIIGFFSGFLIALSTGHINPYAYFDSAEALASLSDITGGLIKAAIFGILITLISCYSGLKASEGAKDVGLVTTSAVAISLITVFISNYFLSALLF